MPKIKLKPCPFCGGVPVVLQTAGLDKDNRLCEIICKCGARLVKRTKDTAKKAWNRRAENGKID